jgi:hypothetical protein
MQFSGLTLDEFKAITETVSNGRYNGNVKVTATNELGEKRFSARLYVTDSHGPGSRTSWSGRHGPYACWHAYRDVFHAMFEKYPDAVARGGRFWVVVYRGLEGFLETYPDTAYKNIGSEYAPVTMPELCDCQ